MYVEVNVKMELDDLVEERDIDQAISQALRGIGASFVEVEFFDEDNNAETSD